MYFAFPDKSTPRLEGVGAYHVAQAAAPVASAGLGQTTFVNPAYPEMTPYPYIKGPVYTRPVFREHARGGNFRVQPIVRMPSLRGLGGLEESQAEIAQMSESDPRRTGYEAGCADAKTGMATGPEAAMEKRYGSIVAAGMAATGANVIFSGYYGRGYGECSAGGGGGNNILPVTEDPGTPKRRTNVDIPASCMNDKAESYAQQCAKSVSASMPEGTNEWQAALDACITKNLPNFCPQAVSGNLVGALSTKYAGLPLYGWALVALGVGAVAWYATKDAGSEYGSEYGDEY